jgi:hypothetical protein
MSEDRERESVGLSFLAERARTRRGAGRTGGGDTPPVEVTVRCEGQRHRVLLTGAGRLSLPDHPKEEVRRHLDYQEVGGGPCPCVAVLIAWRRFVRSGEEEAGAALPKALREAARERHGLATARWLVRVLQRDELPVSPFHERPGFLAEVIGDLIRRQWKFPDITCQVRPPFEEGDRCNMLIFRQGERFLRELDLQPGWFRGVCQTGLAFHEGYLVLFAQELQGQEGSDTLLYRCRPVGATNRPPAFERDWVTGTRGPAGDFRVVDRVRLDH